VDSNGDVVIPVGPEEAGIEEGVLVEEKSKKC
jgi:hypothetical protein